MDLLTLIHEDFTLSVACDKYHAVYGKAQRNIGDEALLSVYAWSEPLQAAFLTDSDGIKHDLLQDAHAPALFFDNTDYPVWVEFGSGVTDGQLVSALKSDEEHFRYHSRQRILSGFINYSNDIGKSEICIAYRKDGTDKRFTFSFEVLSTKLDYHSHWRAIVDDIEAEYRMLSLDYLRRTFHGFAPSQQGETPDLIWWNIFQGEQRKFLQACRTILQRPRHRLHRCEEYLRADHLTRVPACIENELAEHHAEAAHLYRIDRNTLSNDTPENRFLKYALGDITKHYRRLADRIQQNGTISDTQIQDIDHTASDMQRLLRHPFFRTVGAYKGLSQESLVLQQAAGYSQLYRTWNLLRRAYSLCNSMYRLQTKDIATLYEIWCFIEVSHIVQQQLGLQPGEVEQRNRPELNGLFTWELGKGEQSHILFQKDGIELAELVYNPKQTDNDKSSISMPHLVTRTVAQKPDIVLQLTKNDLQKDLKFTYLFDAKYRIGGKTDGVDTPPDDAINQMHRYRDAIYYRDYASNTLKKEVIGGYILFPGNGETAEVETAHFYQSIREVNIGAFPLRPRDEQNKHLLEHFINELIVSHSSDILTRIIPQKATYTEVGNRVLLGLVRQSTRPGYYQSFLNGTAELYYTGAHFPTTISLHDLHFFMPIIKGKGVRDVYEITAVRTITSREARQQATAPDNDMRLAFSLRPHHRQYPDYRPIDPRQLKDYTFIDTTFDHLAENILPL